MTQEFVDTSYTLNPEIIKACDIRGIYPGELAESSAYHIGRAFGTMLQRENRASCAAGYDGRLSSPPLFAALVQGLVKSGIQVYDLGLVPTPAVYHMVMRIPADAGVVVTASHNPAAYNGFKFLYRDALFFGDKIRELAELSAHADFITPAISGTVSAVECTEDYIRYLAADTNLSPMHCVWDPGNGAVAVLLKKFLAHIPGTHRIICGEVDGTFPHHHPDPSSPGNLEMLSQSVIQEKADAGIAFDGDGDRLGLVDELGRVVTGDQLLTIFARDYLTRHPGEAVMSEVKASAVLYREISEGGGVPVMWKVGHAYQKEKMKQDGIGLAGETSGHIFFRENYGFDDGLFSAVKLLSMLSRQSLTLAEIIETIPKIYSTGELRLALDSETRKRMLQHITRSLERDGRELITIDGIRVSCGRGYWMLRSSNTQPHITIYCESETAEGLTQCRAEMVSHVTRAGVDFDSVLVKP